MTILLHPRLSLIIFPQMLPHQKISAFTLNLQQSKTVNFEQLAELKTTYSPGFHTFNPDYVAFFSKLELINIPKKKDWLIRYESPRLQQTVYWVSTSFVFPDADSYESCEYAFSRIKSCFDVAPDKIRIISMLNHQELNQYYSLLSIDRVGGGSDSYWLLETEIER